LPAGAEDLALASSGQHEQSDDIRGLPIGVLGQRRTQRRDFPRREIASPLVFMVTLDALDRVVDEPLPPDRLREQLRRDGGHPIRDVGAALRHLPMQTVDIGEGDIGDFDVLEGGADIGLDGAAIVVLSRRSLNGAAIPRGSDCRGHRPSSRRDRPRRRQAGLRRDLSADVGKPLPRQPRPVSIRGRSRW
jgi:hypothetical protein